MTSLQSSGGDESHGVGSIFPTLRIGREGWGTRGDESHGVGSIFPTLRKRREGWGTPTVREALRVLFLADIIFQVCGQLLTAAVIANRGAGFHLQRHYSGPGWKIVVFLVVDGRTYSDFGGEFIDGNAQHGRGFQLFFIGLARVVPAAGDDVLAQGAWPCLR